MGVAALPLQVPEGAERAARGNRRFRRPAYEHVLHLRFGRGGLHVREGRSYEPEEEGA